MFSGNHAAMPFKFLDSLQQPLTRTILGGMLLLFLSSCAQAVQPWHELRPTHELKQLNVENFLLKQEVAKYRKKLMLANLENKKLAEQLQSRGQRPVSQAVQQPNLAESSATPAMQQPARAQSNVMSSLNNEPSKASPAVQPSVMPLRKQSGEISAARIDTNPTMPASKQVATSSITENKDATLNLGSAKQEQAAIKWTRKMRLFFGSGHKGTSPAMRRMINAFAKDLPPTAKIRVAGHSDSEPVGGFKNNTHTPSHGLADNMAVSKERASAVVRALIAAGINHKRIQVGGFGSTKPLASNDTAEGRAKNRRVDLYISEQ